MDTDIDMDETLLAIEEGFVWLPRRCVGSVERIERILESASDTLDRKYVEAQELTEEQYESENRRLRQWEKAQYAMLKRGA